jgi:hypothetical protein
MTTSASAADSAAHTSPGTENLAHISGVAREREPREPLRLGLEPYERVRAEVAEPDLVSVVDVHRVRLRIRPGKRPFAP